jgi:hypothetical protein
MQVLVLQHVLAALYKAPHLPQPQLYYNTSATIKQVIIGIICVDTQDFTIANIYKELTFHLLRMYNIHRTDVLDCSG